MTVDKFVKEKKSQVYTTLGKSVFFGTQSKFPLNTVFDKIPKGLKLRLCLSKTPNTL